MNLTSLWQSLLPHHPLSRLVLRLTRVRSPAVKNSLIRAFVRGYDIDLGEAVQGDALAYASFNDFFTRALKPTARPIAREPGVLASPVDGTVSQAGPIAAGRLLQAKGRYYDLDTLLSGAAPRWSEAFREGEFATLYLAPYNYHRIHMPCDGTLREAWYVPGRLFSVNTQSAASIKGLFARNERVVLLFDGPMGPFALILVGALFVGSMTTIWHGDITPRRPREPLELPVYGTRTQSSAQQGEEMGRFNMGSTVVLVLPPGTTNWLPERKALDTIRMGQPLARITRPPEP